jgi:hypothetical protein
MFSFPCYLPTAVKGFVRSVTEHPATNLIIAQVRRKSGKIGGKILGSVLLFFAVE